MVVRGPWWVRGTAALVGGVLVLAALLLRSTSPAAEAGSDRCASFRDGAAERAALVTGWGPETLVVGDSWAAGLGLDDLRDSWAVRLPGRVRVAGFSGSGFSARASGCGAVSFASRAARALTPHTSLVVVEGGLNDVDRTRAEVRAGFDRLVAVLEGRRVVVVGPAAAPSRAEAAAAVDRQLRRLTLAAGWEHVAAYDWELDYLPDDLHLTAAGHAEFGDRVRAALDRPAPPSTPVRTPPRPGR